MNCLGILRQRKIPYGDFSNTAPCPAIPCVFLILGHIRCPRMSMHALGYPWRAHGAPMAPFGAPNFRMMSRHITYPQIHISHSERSVCTCFGPIPAIEIMGLLKRKLLYTSRRLFRWNERLRKTLLRQRPLVRQPWWDIPERSKTRAARVLKYSVAAKNIATAGQPGFRRGRAAAMPRWAVQCGGGVRLTVPLFNAISPAQNVPGDQIFCWGIVVLLKTLEGSVDAFSGENQPMGKKECNEKQTRGHFSALKNIYKKDFVPARAKKSAGKLHL